MPLRINGFSGMDIDSMVKQLMTAKRVPLDKLNQQKTYLSWQRDSYREMNSKVFAFKTKLSATDLFGKTSNMTAQTAVVSGNTDALKADASANASTVPMSVTIKSLASKTNVQSGEVVIKPASDSTPSTKASLTTTIGELNGYKPTSDPAPTDDKPETFQIKVNDENFSFSTKDTISNVLSKINNSNANVLASFDEVSGRISITAKEFGSNKTVTISESKYESNIDPNSGDSTKPSTLLGLLNMTNAKVNEGKDGEVEISTLDPSGKVIGSNLFATKDNTLKVNGITLTLMKVTGDNPSTVTTTVDTTKAIDTIKSFIKDYNDLINTMNSKVDEEKYRDYTPLTDEQKSAMKENDITAWEAKAKSGLLKNDDILKDTINSMRLIINNNMGQLSSMGITTGQYYEGGKLTLDEAKLTEALKSNPQQLSDIFQGTNGIVNKLSTTMTSTLQKFSDRAGTNRFSGDLNSTFKEESVMGKRMKDYTSQITAMLKRLDDAEDRYYKQFTAMETAMSKLQSQSSSLFGNSSQ
ncbi:flagellar hook-associated protein 2 [Paenibacillus sp. J23TS9]|uniref:flagellar filament capping protein FliD n=1 Tax=Paenibacillus sp. J23TS9 TaxID=2807193 RepID=UPI001B14C75A|nr:flagellar filament capping protein FliD [Paenibacillus sp. J23TS9]GIP28701.1 flagellar hook-associated protein 2 [Paenibacillus sp. J23TS9]